jgi:nitrogenase molybdenum-iron protein alpha/beta subunit
MGEADDDFLRRVAEILGNSSAAAKAIAERERRRNLGEDAVIYWVRDKGVIYVGPRAA